MDRGMAGWMTSARGLRGADRFLYHVRSARAGRECNDFFCLLGPGARVVIAASLERPKMAERRAAGTRHCSAQELRGSRSIQVRLCACRQSGSPPQGRIGMLREADDEVGKPACGQRQMFPRGRTRRPHCGGIGPAAQLGKQAGSPRGCLLPSFHGS